MSPSARSAQLHHSQVVELIQWLEDVAADGSRARVVTLASTDAARRQATIRGFYERIVRHPRFGRAWPATLPAGSLAPFFPPDRDDTPNGFMWFGVCGSREPVSEAAQFLAQFQAVRVLPDHDEWIYDLPYAVLDGVCASPRFESAADYADQAFGLLGDPQGKDSAQMRTIVRSLDTLVEANPLLPDGGVLEHDGPRLRARAMLAAGWLQRFARRTPVVLVIDEAQHAGSFVTELVAQLAASTAPILIVLSGQPIGADTFVAAAGERLAGPLGAMAGSPVPVLGLPSGEVGRLTGLLATAMPSTLFTRRHLERACEAIGALHAPQQLLETLLEDGWARVIDEPVLAFADDEHLFAARDAALSIFEDEIDSTCAALCLAVQAETNGENLLERVVAHRAASVWADPTSAMAFTTARLLAMQGDLEGALALSGAASNPLQAAVVAGWEQTAGLRIVTPDDFPNEQQHCAETLVVQAAVLARRHPATARAKLARAIERMGAFDRDATGDDLARVRFAAARVSLSLGDLEGVERALVPAGRYWLTERTNGELDRLDQWRRQPGFVARSVDVIANLVAITTLRHHVPDSISLGHFLVGRLALLEKLDRLGIADDSRYVADEACTAFARFRFEQPVDHWNARAWCGWVHHRRGDTDGALRELDALAAEQARLVGLTAPERLRTLARKGRCLVDAKRFAEAHDLLHEVRDELAANPTADQALLAEVRHWHAETIAAAGDFVSAGYEMSGVVAWRAANLPPDDEDLLSSRHRYAFSTLRTGAASLAAAEMREVVTHREQLDLPDSPRLLAARLSFGAYLMQLGRPEEGIGELQEVVHHRSEALAASDPLVVDARAELGSCLLVLGRFDDAFGELDEVVRQREAAGCTDEFPYLVIRQQRAVCLRSLGRFDEADRELDAVAVAVASSELPADHPFAQHVQSLRVPVAAEAIAGTSSRGAGNPEPPLFAFVCDTTRSSPAHDPTAADPQM